MRVCGIVITAAVVMLGTLAPVSAQGLSELHSKVIVGKKICFADHYHSGSSNGQSSREAAEKAAIRSWVDFTSWEYGRQWGDFWTAVGRRIKCGGSGNNWSCDVEARPCRWR